MSEEKPNTELIPHERLVEQVDFLSGFEIGYSYKYLQMLLDQILLRDQLIERHQALPRD